MTQPMHASLVDRLARRALVRGESLIAKAGLGGAAIMVTALGACAWWTLHNHAEAADALRERRVAAVGSLLAAGAEGLIAGNELSTLRRMVSNAALEQDLARCRITLPDGTVIADGVSSAQPPFGELPPTWAAGTAADAASIQHGPDGALEGRFPITVTGRGGAVLELADTPRVTAAETWQLRAGIGAIAAAALAAMWIGYRAMRKRVRALGAIGEALRFAGTGQPTESELVVSDELGPEAAAWNRLVADRQRLREQTAAVHAAEKLASRRSRDGELGALCDALWLGIILVDDQARVKYANGAAAVFLKAKRESLPGIDLRTCLDDPRIATAIQSVTVEGARNRSIIELRREPATDGADSDPGRAAATVLRVTVRPLRKEDSATALVVIEDVTQQRVADEARNGFVAQATHELRTPLTNIRLYLEMLVEGGGADDPVKRSESLNTISGEVRRLERIVGDMLSVSEIEAGSLKLVRDDVRINTVFDEMQADFREQAAHKEIRLKFDLPPKLPVLRGDRDKIVMAIHNLIANAIKYTPAGGEVTVRAADDKGGFVVEVIDNGIGIRDDERELIFEKFYRAKDRRITSVTGTGLGLAIAREVVRLHGGDITVRSQLDKGSTFTMTLPAAA